ncbi:hypothetical protein KM914_21090 [Virgibacillus pantothenticus]|uniref:hypothetical protein n=1 Tax=Virgibacillus pantothenticus TaxID=1473 RepID=UPI001C248561|nr:hypothetical protein [Virgibacillus pantothenticus]MBU8568864.1 hypothetical protein [Virgibacillus pantothenticus]MBU8601898.1 hypothetical protein [Virgibacillus pantothenticus]MBU8636009.1 hypothetical protein [Virgibacillus pantothenticus]MBU8644757.1 hypothetical protein [Virgibacillus pantothenticus]MBU8647961.1 hypothetical protein [Virgibacillus pantothenticus]
MKKFTLVLLIAAFGFLVGWDKQESATSLESDEITKEFIEENLDIGMTEAQVIDLLGEADAIGRGAKDYLPTWRYDIGVPEGYFYEEPDEQFREEGILDTVDKENIKNGTVKMQLLLGWKEGRINFIANTYLENDKLVTYYMLSNGMIKYESF